MIDKETIKKTAKLARLQLTEVEMDNLQKQLSKVLENFEQIAKIPTDGVEPLVTPTDMPHLFRADDVSRDFGAEKTMLNAPERIGNNFKVPPVV